MRVCVHIAAFPAETPAVSRLDVGAVGKMCIRDRDVPVSLVTADRKEESHMSFGKQGGIVVGTHALLYGKNVVCSDREFTNKDYRRERILYL